MKRCLTIARSHALLSNPKNALAVLARASEKSTTAYQLLSSLISSSDSSPPNISVSSSEVEYLKILLHGEVQRYRALVELSNLSGSTQQNNDSVHRQPLIERLNDYPAKVVDLENLVSYPPKLEPIPVKPLFFDAAWNYIEYPGREVEEKVVENSAKGAPAVADKSAEQAAQQKKGWFGFVRS